MFRMIRPRRCRQRTPRVARHPRKLCALLVTSLAPLCVAHADVAGRHERPSAALTQATTRLQIAPSGWGDTDLARLDSLLKTIAATFDARVPARTARTIRIEPGESNPMVLYARGAHGEYIVHLSARDGRWYQFAYQFAHELCHIHANYANKPLVDEQVVSVNQWFEESLCEAVALLTLDTLAQQWESRALDNPWSAYAPAMRRYARMLRQAPHRRLPSHQSLATWYAERRDTLRNNPYLREQDEVVSNQLLTVLEQHPDGLAAIGYLNAQRADATKRFEDYLEAWCLACPERYRPMVERVLALFDLPPPAEG